LEDCEHNTAFALANNVVIDVGSVDNGVVGREVTPAHCQSHGPVLRTLEHFYYTQGPAFLLIDIVHTDQAVDDCISTNGDTPNSL
jgi:hypothetical protein